MAARALWQLGQCQEKLGQRREAHATYVAFGPRLRSPKASIAAQARGKLAGWSDALPGPAQSTLRGGRCGKDAAGLVRSASGEGLRQPGRTAPQGLPDNGGCAVVIAPAIATAPDSVGNLMQSFRAAAYRGKTVRLRAWVRVEAGGPEDRAQMWLRVDRPNGKVGFLEDMDGRPVRSAEWTSCEIVAEIDERRAVCGFRNPVDGPGTGLGRRRLVRCRAGRTGDRGAQHDLQKICGPDASLTAFRFSGQEAVATARKTTPKGPFTLVELSRDTWVRGEARRVVSEHVPLSRGYEAPVPEPDVVRVVVADLKQFAKPLSGLEPFRSSAGCVAIRPARSAGRIRRARSGGDGGRALGLEPARDSGCHGAGPLAGRASFV